MSDNDLEAKEIRFNNFLNKTIILSAKNCYKKEIVRTHRELNIIDDDNFSDFLQKYIKYEDVICDFKDLNHFLDNCDNENLVNALKKLSLREKNVLFFFFIKGGSYHNISKILNIHYFSACRIKNRAINKLKKYLKGRS